MFVCKECGALFDEPVINCDMHGLNAPPYEVTQVCPSCGGTFCEAPYCRTCGEPISGEYIELYDGSAVCPECYSIKNTEN